MKISLICLLLIVICAVHSSARCAGRPNNPSCIGGRNVGRRGRLRQCTGRKMWYYDAATTKCKEMRYLGCGGNSNRWCTKAACVQRCHR